MAGWHDYPALFRHMVVAIHGKSGRGGAAGVVQAMRIARDQLGKWGYLYHRGGNEVLEGIQLTGKGWLRNQKHLGEGLAGMSKDLQFARLFKMIEPDLAKLDGPSGKKDPDGTKDPSTKSGDDQNEIDFDDKPRSLYPPVK